MTMNFRLSWDPGIWGTGEPNGIDFLNLSSTKNNRPGLEILTGYVIFNLVQERIFKERKTSRARTCPVATVASSPNFL
jgi:hypothetical protein